VTRHAKRTDANQEQIVSELRSYGYRVKVTSQIGQGFPDILVSRGKFGIGVEIKDKGKRKQLTDSEVEMRYWWMQLGMRYIVVENTSEILKSFKKLTEKL